MAKEHKDKDFVEFVVKSIVNHPDEVEITRSVDEMGVLLELKVHPEDIGVVIGRKGSTAKAIRSLVRIVGLKQSARVNVKILEPEEEAGGGKKKKKKKDTDEVVEDLEL